MKPDVNPRCQFPSISKPEVNLPSLKCQSEDKPEVNSQSFQLEDEQEVNQNRRIYYFTRSEMETRR